MKKEILNHIKEAYVKGKNIMQYLRELNSEKNNSIEDIMISYDFQAGTYTKLFFENYETALGNKEQIARIIQKYYTDAKDTVLEVGVGEGNTLCPVIQFLKIPHDHVYAFDISWSRIKYAQKFEEQYFSDNKILTGEINYFVADMKEIPLKNASMDIVYSVHALEPNGGKEVPLLKELYRVANKYLILIEPSYETASEEGQGRMEQHGYVMGLYDTAIQLGFDVVEHREIKWTNESITNPLNPSQLIVIKKHNSITERETTMMPFCCPLTKQPITNMTRSSYFSKDSMLAYPLIEGVPILLSDNSVVATHFCEFI